MSTKAVLNGAQEEHIIRINVNPPRGTHDELEDQLQSRYSLKARTDAWLAPAIRTAAT